MAFLGSFSCFPSFSSSAVFRLSLMTASISKSVAHRLAWRCRPGGADPSRIPVIALPCTSGVTAFSVGSADGCLSCSSCSRSSSKGRMDTRHFLYISAYRLSVTSVLVTGSMLWRNLVRMASMTEAGKLGRSCPMSDSGVGGPEPRYGNKLRSGRVSCSAEASRRRRSAIVAGAVDLSSSSSLSSISTSSGSSAFGVGSSTVLLSASA
jgi:hypothetical protein